MTNGALLRKRRRVGGNRQLIPMDHPLRSQLFEHKLLRCPWCTDGCLLPPTVAGITGSGRWSKQHVSICTNGSLCAHESVIQNDSTLTFSCISGEDLLLSFYEALENHLQSCPAATNTHKSCEHSPWSVVAERSVLFSDSARLDQCNQSGLGTMGPLAPYFDGPVFYFLCCEDCGEKKFVC
uniref:Uncharacterized protein n=1 Tax=Trypanosoma congolense (strain IL3000) TaxID=1068625 RepID=G0US34_TRYCI|nr:conserved hypothetical protein [Trypanosoma congolense IL3000]